VHPTTKHLNHPAHDQGTNQSAWKILFNYFPIYLLDKNGGIPYLWRRSGLQIGDFQTAASRMDGPLTPVPSGSWYAFDLTDAGDLVNKVNAAVGLTQVRLRFRLDDNDDEFANNTTFFSGPSAFDRRVLRAAGQPAQHAGYQ
jgi:hypothetical protein